MFDWWPGDDTNQFKKVIALLKQVSDKSKIFFICGNRDYLIGKKFAKETNITILPDHQLIKLGKEKAIILHGDTLCTDDKRYQRFRKFSRSWISKKGFLLFPKYLKDLIFNFAQITKKTLPKLCTQAEDSKIGKLETWKFMSTMTFITYFT